MESKSKSKQSKKDKIAQFKPFRALLLGRSNVGKTFGGLKWCLSMIMDGIFHPKRVILVSKTFKTDPSQSEFIDYCSKKYNRFVEENCFEDVDLQLLNALFEGQKQIKELAPDKLKHYLIVFDDQISNNLIKRSDKDPTLKQLFCVGRHYFLNQVWMLQRFKGSLDPTCRDQFTILSIWKQGNKRALLEMLADYDESPIIDHKKGLQQLFDHYLDCINEDNYGHLVIHTLISHGQGRLQRGLQGNHYFDKS